MSCRTTIDNDAETVPKRFYVISVISVSIGCDYEEVKRASSDQMIGEADAIVFFCVICERSSGATTSVLTINTSTGGMRCCLILRKLS